MELLSKLFQLAGGRNRSVSNAVSNVIVNDLGRRGYHVIPEFLPPAVCARICGQFDELLSECQEKIQHGESEGTSGDYRLWRVEHRIPELADVARHPLIHSAATAYIRTPVVTHAIMMNKVEYRAGKTSNSGGGWHRDTIKPQVKALLYLNDVGPDNGPFTLVPRSRVVAIAQREGAKATRFADETIDEFVQRHSEKPVEFTGAAGTCIIADTSNVHRGKNIAAGHRYCATNYIKEDTPESWKSSQDAWGRYFLDAK